jgi:hypothetical protein
MNILKRKSEILDDFKNNMPGSRKRQRRATGNEDINQLCWDWFQESTGFGNFDFHSDTIVTFTSPLSPDIVRKRCYVSLKKIVASHLKL